jgi:hypothetical protein
MRFDYDAAGLSLVSRILNENSRRLSRTRAGVSDTSTSTAKQPLLLHGAELRRRAAENEEFVHQFLFEMRHVAPPRDPEQVLTLLWAIADRTNEGLVAPGHRFRAWPSRSLPPALAFERVNPEELPAALDRFAADVCRRWPELETDPVPLASWAEWELSGGKLHPFYDGCGRISRCFGALLLMRASYLLPLYEDQASYYAHGHEGPQPFAAYVTERIHVCARWLRAQSTGDTE